ncbi:MAG: hypothetical protein HC918_10480 [Oscillatoriales cyanobacterium SM2_1_8]|nr:hypothetical protein [Oscillatoriales cyanobacterium SM2_1_8]
MPVLAAIAANRWQQPGPVWARFGAVAFTQAPPGKAWPRTIEPTLAPSPNTYCT